MASVLEHYFVQDLLQGLGVLLTLQTSVNKNRKKEMSKTLILVM